MTNQIINGKVDWQEYGKWVEAQAKQDLKIQIQLDNEKAEQAKQLTTNRKFILPVK